MLQKVEAGSIQWLFSKNLSQTWLIQSTRKTEECTLNWKVETISSFWNVKMVNLATITGRALKVQQNKSIEGSDLTYCTYC